MRAMPSRARWCGLRPSSRSSPEPHAPDSTGCSPQIDVEQGRLAGAVGADEPGDGRGVDGEIDLVQRPHPAEVDDDLLDLEERHGPHCRTRSRAAALGGGATLDERGFRRTLVVFIGLQLGQVMSSLDGTIVATALPTIVDDVGGFSRVTWVVSAYSLAMVASMPLYGKLGDLYGRRRILLRRDRDLPRRVRGLRRRRRRWTSSWSPASSRASAAAGSARSRWRRSPTSSPPASSAGGSATRA